jgi:polysaccharide biosynthesis/export protein
MLVQRTLASVLGVALAAGACTIAPGIRAPGASDAVEEEDDRFARAAFDPEVREITPQLLARQRAERRAGRDSDPRRSRRDLTRGYGYRMGPGDVLNIIVWEHPELTNPAGVTTGTLEQQGRLVREDGTIFFPFVGTVQAEGRTVEEIRQEISAELATYLDDPQVDVRVIAFRSKRVYVTGEVTQPGPIYLDDRPVTMLDALARAGGLTEQADRRRAYLTRGDRRRRIDLWALSRTGQADVVLRDGDVLHVPDNYFNQVVVMGEVLAQTLVPLREGRLTLAEAIAAAEGIELRTADTSRIVVVRGEPVRGEEGELEGVRPIVFVLDSRDASDLLLAQGFQLEPRDIVFIPASTAERINRVLDQILPPLVDTIQAVWMTDRLIND